MKERKFIRWYWALHLFALLSALSLLPLIWIGNVPEENRHSVLILCGGLFWGFFFLEMLTLIPCSKLYWHLRQAHRRTKIHWRGDVRIGAISFFKNREGLFSDLIAFALTVTTLALYFLRVSNSWIVIFLVVLTLLSLNMRCLLNGRNRNLYLKLKKERRTHRDETN